MCMLVRAVFAVLLSGVLYAVYAVCAVFFVQVVSAVCRVSCVCRVNFGRYVLSMRVLSNPKKLNLPGFREQTLQTD